MNGDNESLLAAKKKAEQLMQLPGVSGIGIKKKVNPGESIRVYVEKRTRELDNILPRKIDSHEIEVVETGRFEFMQMQLMYELGRTGRNRPAPGGVSIGHYTITAGTLGSRVYDAATGRRLILSNNHVLAAAAGINNIARVGDAILQPGAYDGGTLDDKIAALTRWIPYNRFGNNIVDCAVATPLNDADLSDEIMEIGVPGSQINTDVYEDMDVMKSGRTTGVKSGKILDTDVSMKVYLDDTNYLQFEDQIITQNIGSPGDSGSLVMDVNHAPIGLLFAGSTDFTAVNKILPVCQKLGINFGEPVAQPPIQAGSWILFAAALGIPVGYLLFRKNKGGSSAPFKL